MIKSLILIVLGCILLVGCNISRVESYEGFSNYSVFHGYYE